MAKLTLAGLKKRREALAAEIAGRSTPTEEIQVIVGLGTCGVAAGAEAVLTVFREELERAGVKNVVVRRTGCMGLCHSEPTVEVAAPGMPAVVYGRVDSEAARKIVGQHIVRGLLVNDHVYDKPAADIVRP